MKSYYDRLKKVAGVISIIGILLMVGTLLVTSCYSVMIADDFWYAKMTGRFTGFWDYLKLSWNYMIYEYKNYQGTYFSEFICALMNPVSWGGFPLLRILMVANCIFSFGSILAFAYTLLNGLFKGEKYIKAVILACIVFTITQFNVFQEIFFWYIGAGVYSVPLSMAFVSMTGFILMNRDKYSNNSLLFAIVLITGFLGVGGSLAVSGAVTYSILVLAVYYLISTGKLSKRNIVVFAVYMAGSVVSTIAPGNYARQSVETSMELNFIKSLNDTIQVTLGDARILLTEFNYEVVLIILLVCGILLSEKVIASKKAWLVSGILALAIPFVAVFPVVLGYNVQWIPNRCLYILTVCFSFCFADIALILGTFIGELLNNNRKRAVYILCILALVLAIIDNYSVRSYKAVRLLKGLYEGTYQEYYANTRALIENLENHKGEDVVVDVPDFPEYMDNYYCFYLKDDPNIFINSSVAWAYELNSIVNSRVSDHK